MRPLFYLVTLFALIVGFCLFVGSVSGADLAPLITTLGLGVGMAFAIKDASTDVTKTKALPNGAATITSDGIDLGHGSFGDFLANAELVVSAPAVTTTELGDTQTLTYSIEHDDASDFSTVATLIASCIVQTGAGGAGAAAATYTARLPVDVKRYVRVKCVKAGASNASTASLTARLQF